MVCFIDDRGSCIWVDVCNVVFDEIDFDLVMFIDDDVIVFKEWVFNLVCWFE